MSIYILLHIILTQWQKSCEHGAWLEWQESVWSTSDKAQRLFMMKRMLCLSRFFYWFVSFGCLLWGVNFLHEKRQSLSRQYFITIWRFPEVLPPNHRLVFKAKSNVFLSWAIWYLKHQLHGKSLACLLNDSQSVYSNGWQIFVSRYTITVENYQGCIQSICKL